MQRKLNEPLGSDLTAQTTVENIEKDPRIKIIILGAIYKRGDLVGEFLKHGWTVHSTYQNNKYGSSVIVMTRLQG
jgi:hypothetical protein